MYSCQVSGIRCLLRDKVVIRIRLILDTPMIDLVLCEVLMRKYPCFNAFSETKGQTSELNRQAGNDLIPVQFQLLYYMKIFRSPKND